MIEQSLVHTIESSCSQESAQSSQGRESYYREVTTDIAIRAEPHTTANAKTGSAADESGTKAERNRILTSLSASAYSALLPHMESVSLVPQQLLYEGGVHVPYVYFPQSGIVALVRRSSNDESVGVRMVGSEGMVGATTSSPASVSPTECVVQSGGTATRISAAAFYDEIAADARADSRADSLSAAARRYADARLDEALQSVLCQSYHTVVERCARWLLMTDDRVTQDNAGAASAFSLTHDFLATMLGVRRAGVTVAAGSLQRAGLIQYSRGRIVITDREGLRAQACACYVAPRAAADAGE